MGDNRFSVGYQKWQKIIAVGLAVTCYSLLVACMTNETQPPIILTPSPEISQEATLATEEVTITVTEVTVEATVVPKPSSTPTLRPIPVSVPDDFFFGIQSTNCELPCWQGITVDQSTVDDTLVILNDLYGTPRPISVVNNLPLGLDGIAPAWIFGQSSEESFAATIVFDEETRYLEGLRLGWYGSRFVESMSIQRILEKLGSPERILVAYEIGGQVTKHANGHFYLMYASGLTVYISQVLPVVTTTINNSQMQAMELCVDWIDTDASGRIMMTAPLSADLGDLTPVQGYFYGDISTIQSINDLFGVEPEEVTEQIQQGNHPCLYAPVSD